VRKLPFDAQQRVAADARQSGAPLNPGVWRQERAATVIFSDVTATAGKTPLVELGRLARGLPGCLVAKLEIATRAQA
jgi:hypothetical protein